MNPEELTILLEQLDSDVWQSLLEGKALRLVDDEFLELTDANQRNLIVNEPGIPGMDVEVYRQQILGKVDELVTEYYLRNPLSLSAFNRQVEALFSQYGAAAFAAEYGELPERSLFVEVGDVLALNAENPRHRYGAFCELDGPLSGPALEAHMAAWLDSQEAYEKYISMNVCRYSC